MISLRVLRETQAAASKKVSGFGYCGWQTFCKRNFEGLCKSFFLTTVPL